MKSPRSKKQTLILCMEMYEWLRDNPGVNKYNWPKLNEYRHLERYHACFCCLFAKFDCTGKCPLVEWAWFEEESSSAPCVHSKSLAYGTAKGADKMVWACYVALNSKYPKEFPL